MKRDGFLSRGLCLGAALMFCGGVICFAADRPADLAPPFDTPYTRPSVESVSQVMARVRDRLENGVVMKITSGANPRATTDPSEPKTVESLDRGLDKKFEPLAYPMGVVYAAMIEAGDATGDPAYDAFVARRFQFFADNLAKLDPHLEAEAIRRNPFRNLLAPDSLDACGAVGASFIKARRHNIGPDLMPVIQRFADYVSHGQFRLSDGTLARQRPFAQALWADDEYMSVPLLAQMGALTGDRAYFDDAARQILQIDARLFQPSANLFTHGLNLANPDNQPTYYWARANGWIFMATAELLSVLPADHPQRDAVLKMFRAQAKGLASVQSGSGLWHQLLDRPDSYTETSASAMFTFGFARGVNQGWLDAGAYAPVAISAWNELTTRVGPDGAVAGVCIGTGYGGDAVFYYHRPAVDDVHGYGPVIFAGAEIIRLLHNTNIPLEGGGRSSIMLRLHARASADVPTTQP